MQGNGNSPKLFFLSCIKKLVESHGVIAEQAREILRFKFTIIGVFLGFQVKFSQKMKNSVFYVKLNVDPDQQITPTSYKQKARDIE